MLSPSGYLFRWDHRLQIQNLFMAFKPVRNSPMVPVVTSNLGQQYNTGEKPTVVMLSIYIINRHAGTHQTKTKQKHFSYIIEWVYKAVS